MIRYEVTFYEKKWDQLTKTYTKTLESALKYNPIRIRKMEGTRYNLRCIEVIK